jgi:hypothetical protein
MWIQMMEMQDRWTQADLGVNQWLIVNTMTLI